MRLVYLSVMIITLSAGILYKTGDLSVTAVITIVGILLAAVIYLSRGE